MGFAVATTRSRLLLFIMSLLSVPGLQFPFPFCLDVATAIACFSVLLLCRSAGPLPPPPLLPVAPVSLRLARLTMVVLAVPLCVGRVNGSGVVQCVQALVFVPNCPKPERQSDERGPKEEKKNGAEKGTEKETGQRLHQTYHTCISN